MSGTSTLTGNVSTVGDLTVGESLTVANATTLNQITVTNAFQSGHAADDYCVAIGDMATATGVLVLQLVVDLAQAESLQLLLVEIM